MPTVLRIGPYRFHFYSLDGDEPKHIHVESGDGDAKFWLEPVELSWSRGFNNRQINQLEKHINDNLQLLIDAWIEYFEG